MNMKNITLVVLAIALTENLAAQLVPLAGHLDIRCHYNRDADDWACQALTAGPGGGDILRDFSEVHLPLSDKPYRAASPSTSGARNTQPATPAYSFTGVSPGDPIWIAVQGSPGSGEAWPGFENAQATGVLGEYVETDTRLSQPQTLARPWIKVSLKSVVYQGQATGPAFSLWTVTGGSPRVWMATADGLDGQDYFLYSAGSHVHMNWGFAATGIYQLEFVVSAWRGPGQTNPCAASSPFTLTFAVGPFAAWQAGHFTAAELGNNSVSGFQADPDGDGLSNLTEYAFGLDPRNGSTVPEAPRLGLPVFRLEPDAGGPREVLEYSRRRAGELLRPLTYEAGFSSMGAPGSWEGGGQETIADFTGEDAALNAVWEKVRVTRETDPDRRNGFARVFVKQDE